MARDEKLSQLKEAASNAKAAYKKAEADLKLYKKEKLKEAKQAKATKAKVSAAKRKKNN